MTPEDTVGGFCEWARTLPADGPYAQPGCSSADLAVKAVEAGAALDALVAERDALAARLAEAERNERVAAEATIRTRSLLAEVAAERDRQDAKWGGTPGVDRMDDHTYPAVLTEEVGEACKSWLEHDAPGLRAELIQVAAVALAWVEEIDNAGSARALSAADRPEGTTGETWFAGTPPHLRSSGGSCTCGNTYRGDGTDLGRSRCPIHGRATTPQEGNA